jgi:Tol biopolymer transport system component
MGEVYRAKDTRLDRIVALKVLPSELATHPEMRQRFEREAKTISTLSHPHICTLHDIGHQGGVDYLVLEYLEGLTLQKRLEKGPLPAQEILKYAIELADALDKAHRQGFIHRDIKPGNIMLSKSGVKLMDFGLAKLKADPVAASGAPTEATLDDKLTEEGTILGTFQYMAPEQLEGLETDARTDIFAFGEVLYEMATGRPAFSGKSEASLISSILSAQPKPVAELVPTTPPALERVIRRCLEKDPDDRWQSARDLMLELKWIAEGGGTAAAAARAASARKGREGLAWMVAAALAVLLIAGAIWWRGAKPAEEPMFFYAPLPFPARDVAISPNGHTIAVVAYKESARKNAIWIYELGAQGARSLPDTEGASYPFWSADGQSLGFFADAKMKKVELSGGPVQTLADALFGRGGTWNKDGVILFTPDVLGGLYRVSAAGGTPTLITRPDASHAETSHRWPIFLPDQRHFLYLATNFSGKKGLTGIYVGALDSNEKRLVVEATGNAGYVAPGYLLFYRNRTLLAQRFDAKKMALTGEATTIVTDIQFLPQVRKALFAVSDKGVLVAQGGSAVAISQPVWFDRKGKEIGTVGKPDVYGNIFLAPNGKWVAVDKTDMGSQSINIWTLELQGEGTKRLTFDPGLDLVPVWSPDGTRMTYSANVPLIQDLFLKNADGTQEAKPIVQDEQDKAPNDWSRDGKYILYTRDTDLWFISLPELKSSLLLKAVGTLRNGQFSPDGKWVAYASNETGKWEIYVTSFPDARGKWQVSTGGGEQPRWRGDGKELFYLSADGKMMAAPVTLGAGFNAGTPVALFQATPRQPVTNADLFVYDVTRDGQRFLINTPVKQADTTPMTVILNWTAKLNK